MPFSKSVLKSIEPLANILSKTHRVGVAVIDQTCKLLVQTGMESPLFTSDFAGTLWEQARKTEAESFDKCIDGFYISIVKVSNSDKNIVMLAGIARTAESVIDDETQNEILKGIVLTVQSCLEWSNTQRSTVVELMEKYEELTLLYDVSEKLGGLPSFDEVASEMLKEATSRVRCKAGRLVLSDEDGVYHERTFSNQSIPKAALAFRSDEDTAMLCIKKPVTQVVNEPLINEYREMPLTQLHVPICLKENPIGVLSLFRSSNTPFKSGEKKIAEMLARQTAGKLESSRLYARLESLFFASIKMLVECIDARDTYTSGHSSRVSAFSVFLARKVGLPEDQVKQIEIGALLHDVGKIRIRDNILNKPGRLNEEERGIIKNHPEFGKRIVEHVKQLHNTVPCIYCHHESYNGRGYPQELGGEEIPLMGRIVAIADTFDAMTTTRPYRKALSQKEAYRELLRYRGIQFDPDLAEIFADAIINGEFPEDKLTVSV